MAKNSRSSGPASGKASPKVKKATAKTSKSVAKPAAGKASKPVKKSAAAKKGAALKKGATAKKTAATGKGKSAAKPVKKTAAAKKITKKVTAPKKKTTDRQPASRSAAPSAPKSSATARSTTNGKAVNGVKPGRSATKGVVAKPAAKPAQPVREKVQPVKTAPKAQRSRQQPEEDELELPMPDTQDLAEPKEASKEKVQIEYMVRSAPAVLFELLSTPSGFSEWYCDDVHVRGDHYTFVWQGEEENATMIGRKLGEVIRFHRDDDDDENSYFEFRVRIDAMTNEVALIVTDHAWPDEVEETRNLWNSQIANLLRVLGA